MLKLIRCKKPLPKRKDFLSGSFANVTPVTGLVEDQPSPVHTKEFQTLSDTTTDLELIQESATEVEEYVDVPTDVHPIEVSCGTS